MASGLALSVTPSLAAPPVAHLSWGSHLNPSDCPDYAGYRDLEVNVTQQVTNDVDLALADAGGHAWARLEYNRHIQVWKVGIIVESEHFCVLVKYQGSWVTIGASPFDGAPMQTGIEGTFQGGYRARVVGQLDRSGAVRLRGRLAPVDRGAAGLPTFPPPDDWISQYFTLDSEPTAAFWGWIYHGGPNGTFVHACEGGGECLGSSGNITD